MNLKMNIGPVLKIISHRLVIEQFSSNNFQINSPNTGNLYVKGNFREVLATVWFIINVIFLLQIFLFCQRSYLIYSHFKTGFNFFVLFWCFVNNLFRLVANWSWVQNQDPHPRNPRLRRSINLFDVPTPDSACQRCLLERQV